MLFQFGVEQPQHGPPKPLAFELEPAFQFVGRDVVDVHRLLHPRVGVGAFGPHRANEFVVLVGSGKFGRLKREPVDLGI